MAARASALHARGAGRRPTLSRLRIEALRYRSFGPIDLTVAPEECVALSGPSGAGKTLLLRAVADLDPHEGRVYLDDLECHDVPAPEWRRRVGMLPAESQWWYETPAPHFPRVDRDWLDRLGLEPGMLERPVQRLSTGERQRLALLRLLAHRPQALLLDEPTASLDLESQRRAEALLADYRKQHGAPALFVSHDAEQARRIASRHARLLGGRITQVSA